MASAAASDRLAELKAFDDTKAGVKGLVDAGVTAVPRIFHHPPDPHHHAPSITHPDDAAADSSSIPVIDLRVASRAELVAQAPAEARRPYYTRDAARRVKYSSNYDLFQAPAASWRDTLFLEMAPDGPSPEEIPPACRDIVFEYTRQVQSLCGVLLGLLSEALGLHRGYLEHDAGCLDGLSVKAASETAGFFQVVNHGIPEAAMSAMLAALQRFNEAPAEARRPYYTRDTARRVKYSSNYDLFQAPVATWRDTLFLEMAPDAPSPEEIPPTVLLGLLSEALGLHRGYLEHDAGCRDGLGVAAHYYPPCPEPHLTLGAAKHSDPTFLTVLLQDGVGGLQALLGGGRWVDVPPGALVVNVGDFLEIMSNGRLKSVEHRVVASATARVSVACFFKPYGPAASTRVYGPIVEGDDAETPRYRSFTAVEFLRSRLDGRPPLDRFRL
ncbi:hypothetical protein EJB05_24473 [Eragrostis curvula]|uniref:Fe2OG dioxygenase domain-containing protein n=1 Tax=Eragrostis curvula TaxID=38414 RepID=A0A5J9V8Z3_9POAL|nr:hypothetical protein EJB05_24473 [Eragrostis curvula]